MFVTVDYTPDGVTLIRKVENYGDGTASITHYNFDGTVSSIESLSGLEIIPDYPPLDSTGALATLLVVLNIVPIEDAANAIHEEPAHLIAEAEAWSLGQ